MRCKNCNQEFPPTKSWQVFCQTRCREIWHYQQKVQQERKSRSKLHERAGRSAKWSQRCISLANPDSGLAGHPIRGADEAANEAAGMTAPAQRPNRPFDVMSYATNNNPSFAPTSTSRVRCSQWPILGSTRALVADALGGLCRGTRPIGELPTPAVRPLVRRLRKGPRRAAAWLRDRRAGTCRHLR